MDVLLLSRLQFAMTTFFHFIFVPLTLGLSVLIALMESLYLVKKDEEYRTMARFWGKLFLINFALGIVTGITLEFQFGTNWSRYAAYVGDIFGSLLAVEATLAFFLESTFLGVWVFGWKRLSPKLHAVAIWIVALASTVSAFWILAANAWMQRPVGFVLRNGRAELADFGAIVTSRVAILKFVHTVAGSYSLAAFFVMGISAWHLLRRQNASLFGRSFRIAATFGLFFSLVSVGLGHLSGEYVGEFQPVKLAAMESHWETRTQAPLYLVQLPRWDGDGNLVQALPVPGALSFLATMDFDAKVLGLNDVEPSLRPPVLPVFLSFRVMVGLGMLFVLLSFLAWRWRNSPLEHPRLLRILVWSIPLPYLALETGWALAELGRQPWIVQGLMKTADAASPVEPGQVLLSFSLLTLVYLLLAFADGYLLFKFARKGPAPALAAAAPTAAAAD